MLPHVVLHNAVRVDEPIDGFNLGRHLGGARGARTYVPMQESPLRLPSEEQPRVRHSWAPCLAVQLLRARAPASAITFQP
jgi:hypothetical protein